MTTSNERSKIQSDINQKALARANAAVRKELLGDTISLFFKKTLTDITGTNINVLSATWSPFELDMISKDGLGIRLDISDPLVLQLMMDEGLYDRAYQIAMDAFMDTLVISDSTKDFITMLLDDLVVEKDPFYKAEPKPTEPKP